VADKKKAEIAARKGHKSGGRQEMRGKSGANPETHPPHVVLVSCEKTGCLLGSNRKQSEKEGNSREKGEAAGESC
jgi:hypothetical protein